MSKSERLKCGGFYSINMNKQWREIEGVNTAKGALAPIGQKRTSVTL